MRFADLGLSKPILRAVEDAGYDTPSPIQAATIPHVLSGKDVLGCAQTGTGKTAAFSLPLLHRFCEQAGGPSHKPKNAPRALILSPTRELAIQIEESLQTYGKHTRLNSVVIFGGVNQSRQVQAIEKGVDLLVATPGRLMDLVGQQLVDLSHVSVFVLDEADRMLDMGFIVDIRKITKLLPTQKQTLFFSATMPPEIEKLTHELLVNPIKVATEPVSSTVDRIEQRLYHVDKPKKSAVLAHLIKTEPISRAIVFSRTKHGADRIVRQLKRFDIQAVAIHGDKSQNQRQRNLTQFKENKVHVLVATDIAARGIDIDEVSHVFNYDITHEPETHVHRIGRTGRAGQSGVAIALCAEDERPNVKAIEKLTGQKLQVMKDLPDGLKPGAVAPPPETVAAGMAPRKNAPKGQGQKQGNRNAKPHRKGPARPEDASKQPKQKRHGKGVVRPGQAKNTKASLDAPSQTDEQGHGNTRPDGPSIKPKKNHGKTGYQAGSKPKKKFTRRKSEQAGGGSEAPLGSGSQAPGKPARPGKDQSKKGGQAPGKPKQGGKPDGPRGSRAAGQNSKAGGGKTGKPRKNDGRGHADQAGNKQGDADSRKRFQSGSQPSRSSQSQHRRKRRF